VACERPASPQRSLPRGDPEPAAPGAERDAGAPAELAASPRGAPEAAGARAEAATGSDAVSTASADASSSDNDRTSSDKGGDDDGEEYITLAEHLRQRAAAAAAQQKAAAGLAGGAAAAAARKAAAEAAAREADAAARRARAAAWAEAQALAARRARRVEAAAASSASRSRRESTSSSVSDAAEMQQFDVATSAAAVANGGENITSTTTPAAIAAPRRVSKPSKPSASQQAATPPPEPPLRLGAPAVALVRTGAGGAHLTWSPLPRAAAYTAERARLDATSDAQQGPWERIGSISGAVANGGSHGGHAADVAAAPLLRLACAAPLPPGARFAFRLQARLHKSSDVSERGAPANIIITGAVAEVTAPCAAPGPCGAPVASRCAGGDVAVTWRAPSSDGGAPLTSYRLEASAGAAATSSSATSSSYVPMWTGAAAAVTLRPAQLAPVRPAPGAPLRFRVRALNALGPGPPSPPSQPMPAPAMPTQGAGTTAMQRRIQPKQQPIRTPVPPAPSPRSAAPPAASMPAVATPRRRGARGGAAMSAPAARVPRRRRPLRAALRFLRLQWMNGLSALFIVAVMALAVVRWGAQLTQLAEVAAQRHDARAQ
jgi:hypothetical protein